MGAMALGESRATLLPTSSAAPICTNSFSYKWNHVCLFWNLNASNLCLLQPSHRAALEPSCSALEGEVKYQWDLAWWKRHQQPIFTAHLLPSEAPPEGDSSLHYSLMLWGLLSTRRCVCEEQLSETDLFLPEDGMSSVLRGTAAEKKGHLVACHKKVKRSFLLPQQERCGAAQGVWALPSLAGAERQEEIVLSPRSRAGDGATVFGQQEGWPQPEKTITLP